jgi:hypothetical protein
VTVVTPTSVDYDSFAWQVLSTLAQQSSATCAGDQFTVTVTMTSNLEPTGATAPG